MIKILFFAVLCMSALQVQAKCLDFYYGVKLDQPFALGRDSQYYYDDNGEYYAYEQFDSLIHQYDNGTYVVEGTYSQNLQVTVNNEYLGCSRTEYLNSTSGEYNYTRKGFRTPSQIGYNFTKQEVQPNYNITLKQLFQSLVYSYIQTSPVVDPYVLDTIESYATSIQTNQNSQEY